MEYIPRPTWQVWRWVVVVGRVSGGRSGTTVPGTCRHRPPLLPGKDTAARCPWWTPARRPAPASSAASLCNSHKTQQQLKQVVCNNTKKLWKHNSRTVLFSTGMFAALRHCYSLPCHIQNLQQDRPSIFVHSEKMERFSPSHLLTNQRYHKSSSKFQKMMGLKSKNELIK